MARGPVDRHTTDAPTRRAHSIRARAIAEQRTWGAVFERLLGEYAEITRTRRTVGGARARRFAGVGIKLGSVE